MRVLLAEDDEVNLRLTAGLLKVLGHEVIEARDGQEAVDAWRREPLDLVLMDVEMPKLDGLEATRRIRREEIGESVHTPIVALTACRVEGHRERCLAAGMDDYLSKPFTVEKFEALQAERVAGAPRRAPG